jgi:hypothetical protein
MTTGTSQKSERQTAACRPKISFGSMLSTNSKNVILQKNWIDGNIPARATVSCDCVQRNLSVKIPCDAVAVCELLLILFNQNISSGLIQGRAVN